MKSIVLYFSYSGNTDEMAKKAADFTSSDICELKSPIPLSDDIKIVHDMAVEAKLFPKERNAIAVPFDHRPYSVFIIGSPLWLGTYPEFVIDYLKSIDWRGRKIFPFISSVIGSQPLEFRYTGGDGGHHLFVVVKFCPGLCKQPLYFKIVCHRCISSLSFARPLNI